MDDILAEIEGLVKKGCKEVVLTGIHISSYGVDKGESAIIDLVEKINGIEGLERVRLSSLEPRIITRENAKRLGALEKLCPHFHLSLQSGSDSVLKRMNRHYTSADFKAGVEYLREAFENPAITTDIIVGFPGETEEEFEECRKFVEDINFYEIHVFKYSPRKGTVAAGMKEQLTDRQKSERSDVLLNLTKEQSKSYREGFLGKELSVLWEDTEEINKITYVIGHTDKYVRVAVPESEANAYGAISGEISKVIPRIFLNTDTLLI